MKKIGILGGTFNPIHHGHLILGQAAKEEFGLDEILVMPTKNPAYKKISGGVSEKNRVDMIKLAIRDFPYFKFSDIELEDDEKDPAAHNVVAQDNRDDEEHKIVRMNVPFAQPGHGVRGTYFIGYARYWDVTKTMLTNMFTQNDKLLDYSKPITGMLFFIPSLDTLDAIAEGEL